MKEKNIPYHVGIIMDGNGRWANERGLSRSKGHEAGYKAIKEVSKNIFKRGVKVLSVYAFSTDNFKRDEDEVNNLMNLFIKGFKELQNTYNEDNVKIVFSGRREPLRSDVLKAIDDLTLNTKDNTGGIFNVCLNYGGQAEIVDTTKKLINMVQCGDVKIEDIDEKFFGSHLYQDLPPIDLLIRTSGEMRLSGFMLYNSAYSEYYFTDLYFPDFNMNELEKAIDAYNNRDRRFGGIK